MIASASSANTGHSTAGMTWLTFSYKSAAGMRVSDMKLELLGGVFAAPWRRIDDGYALFEHLIYRSEEHTSELQSRGQLVCRPLLEKKRNRICNQRKRTSQTAHHTPTKTNRIRRRYS